MRSLASHGAEGYSSEHSRKIPPDWQVEGPPMKWNINWGSVIATIAIMLTIAGSTAGATRVISSGIAEVKTGQVRLEERLSSQIAELKTGQARLEKRFDVLEKRFDVLEERFDGLEEQYSRLQSQVSGLYNFLLNRSKAPGQPAAESGQTAEAAGHEDAATGQEAAAGQ